jgi:hypothetical protein
MVNKSKIRSKKYWKIWKNSGAISNYSEVEAEAIIATNTYQNLENFLKRATENSDRNSIRKVYHSLINVTRECTQVKTEKTENSDKIEEITHHNLYVAAMLADLNITWAQNKSPFEEMGIMESNWNTPKKIAKFYLNAVNQDIPEL